jgi:hypothetical protein
MRKWLERLRNDGILSDDGLLTDKGWDLLREHLPNGPFGFGLTVIPADAPRRTSSSVSVDPAIHHPVERNDGGFPRLRRGSS